MKVKQDIPFLAVSISFCFIIFIYDLYTPVGWSEWVFYIFPIIIISFSSNKNHLLIISSLSTVLIVLGLVFEPPSINLNIAVFVRITGIIFFWLLTIEFIRRKYVMKALSDSEQRYRSLYEKNPKPLFVYSLDDLKILEINPAAIKKYGFSSDEFLQMRITRLHSEGEGKNTADFYKNLSDEAVLLENCSHVTKYGKIINCNLTSIKLEYGNYQARLVLVIDITDLSQARKSLEKSLEEKEILLKEIHHRVKNNMQVISSLLNMQSRYVKDPESLEYFRQSRSRVEVMSLIHEKLYKSEDYSSIDFGQYIRQLSAIIFNTYKVSPGKIGLEFDMNNIFLGIDSAIPCSLIINELLTNSLKHAFPGGRSGSIEISIHKNTDDGNNFTLGYCDNGIGYPKDFDFNKSDSLGMKLIKTLTGQLQGTLNINNRQGVEYTIIFPGK